MKNILSIAILVLIAIIVLQRTGCKGIPGFEIPKSDTLIVRDTAWQVHDSLIVKKMKVTNTIYEPEYIKGETKYIADTNYAILKAQFDALVKENVSKNIYADTLKLDTLGYIAVADTVQFNKLQNRAFKYNYKIPTITNTVTINNYALPKRQLYIGGGVDATKSLAINQFSAGFILKTKKDQIYGLKANYDITTGISYGFQSYWKIKLR